MKTKKLQELVSNQIASAIETATSANKAEKSSTKKSIKAKKAKVEESTTPDSKAKKTKREKVVQEVSHQQNTAIIEKVISNREVKYIYPDDVVDTLARKRWRQQQRNELHRLEREMYRIKDTNSKEFKIAKKAYEAKRNEVLKTGTDC